MTALRILLIVIFLAIAGYTVAVVQQHGFGLLAVFFGDIAALGWPGQFNLDFLTMLMLSALWVGWRHRFTPGGLGLAVLAFFGGGLFLSAYLLITSYQARGDSRVLLLGPSRA